MPSQLNVCVTVNISQSKVCSQTAEARRRNKRAGKRRERKEREKKEPIWRSNEMVEDKCVDRTESSSRGIRSDCSRKRWMDATTSNLNSEVLLFILHGYCKLNSCWVLIRSTTLGFCCNVNCTCACCHFFNERNERKQWTAIERSQFVLLEF